MKKVKFVQDAKLDPSRYYRNPTDVIRDRRLNKAERLEIVTAWEQALEQRVASAAVPEEGAAEKLIQLQRLRAELAQDVNGPGAETTEAPAREGRATPE